MPQAEEFQVVNANLCVWSAYSSEAKCDLNAAAYIHDGSIVLVDPVKLSDAAWNDLLKLGSPRAIVLTNANHLRDAAYYKQLAKVPVAAGVDARRELGKEVDVVLFGTELIHGLSPISISGAGVGETAFLGKEGTLFIGDAIINPGGELSLLPGKYCTDEKQSRESLRKLLTLSFETVTFAHGLPITQNAKTKLAQVIE